MENKNKDFTKVVKLGNRKGDNALTAYIELWGNPIAQYEKEQHEAKIAKGELVDENKYELKLLEEEKEFFEGELERLD